MLVIGDKVKIRPKIKGGNCYGDIYFSGEMERYRNKEAFIKKTEEYYKNGEIYYKYHIDIDSECYVWSKEMFVNGDVPEECKFKIGDKVIGNEKAEHYGVTKTGYIGEVIEIFHNGNFRIKGEKGDTWNVSMSDFDIYEEEKQQEEVVEEDKNSNEDISELTKAIKNLSKEIKKEDPFKQAMLEGIIEKGKELATEDLRKEIKEDLDKFIQETYGSIPKKIVIERDSKKKEIEGIFHKDFEKICKIVDSNIPLMLVGGAGAGKNYTLEQVAQALDLTFYTTNAVNQDYKLTGFIDANGKYHETEFYKAFVNGGMFFLDEIDASCPEALVTLNSAIANKYFDFPIGRKIAHENFRVVCAGNTYGTGADMVYVGRNVLDGATLDRFVVLEFDYDDEVEKQLAYDDDLFKFIRDLRSAVNKAGLRYIVSMRALINSTKLLQINVDKETILKTTIIKNMQKDDLNTIVEKLEYKGTEWYKEIRKMCDY